MKPNKRTPIVPPKDDTPSAPANSSSASDESTNPNPRPQPLDDHSSRKALDDFIQGRSKGLNLSQLTPEEFVEYTAWERKRRGLPPLSPADKQILHRSLSLTEEQYKLKESLIMSADLRREGLRREDKSYCLLEGLLWEGSVVLMVAETSAGKSVMSHRLARSLTTGEPFLGISPPRCYRVLYIDLENPEGSKFHYLTQIGTDDAPFWDDASNIVKEGDALSLIGLGLYHVVILDNLVNAFDVQNENDNAEMIRYAKLLTREAKRTGACILVLHNTGKGEKEDAHRGRGAQGLIDRVDVKLDLFSSRDRTWQLKVTKSRFGNKGESIKYAWTDQFNYEVITHDKPEPPAQVKMSYELVQWVRMQGRPVERKEILEGLGIQEGADERRFNRALKGAVKDGRLFHPEGKRGLYAYLQDDSLGQNP